MANLTKQQLIAKLKANGIKASESPFTITSLGIIAIADLETFVSKKGNSYLKADDYLIATKPEHLSKSEVEIKVITANKDYKNMKAGDTFAVAE